MGGRKGGWEGGRVGGWEVYVPFPSVYSDCPVIEDTELGPVCMTIFKHF